MKFTVTESSTGPTDSHTTDRCTVGGVDGIHRPSTRPINYPPAAASCSN